VPHITLMHTLPALFINIPRAFATRLSLINGDFLKCPIELSADKQTLPVMELIYC